MDIIIMQKLFTLSLYLSLSVGPRSKHVSSHASDKLELKAVNDGSASYAALEKKAELYDKLVKGELSDEEDKEKYCVDFFRKSLVQDDSSQPQIMALPLITLLIPSLREVHEEASQARDKVSELKLRRQEQAVARREN
ncbi:unnamed protein product [Thlaspi arvense]|uniref:Uncharacterized protein n=1 Tax=Thlaspi arvense TaxID=13288 RepID=A0AAU9RSH8_THLAR|nr:unnamed protein product [Thlaspi arvense]